MPDYLKLRVVFLFDEKLHLRLPRVQLKLEPSLVSIVYNCSVLVQDREVLECAEFARLVQSVFRIWTVLSIDIAYFEVGNRAHLNETECVVVEFASIQVSIVRSLPAKCVLMQELCYLPQSKFR